MAEAHPIGGPGKLQTLADRRKMTRKAQPVVVTLLPYALGTTTTMILP